METTKLRRFAQYARRTLLELVDTRLQLVLQPDSAARREAPAAVKQLETQIQESSREQIIDRVAYTWFNRFCALRFMDINRFNRIGVVSPLDGQFQPEILAEAKMGHIDEEMVPTPIQAKVRALLDGTAPSTDPQQEAYRLLVVAACNYWQRAMPFLFETIADYTELLMPDDLLSGNSILAYTREAMTPDACQDVEVIGWLYQFYISEKKDEVFEGLKKNKKITPENIPAATQLFTPHWIVRYLVENSLGRLWLLNRPNSKLAGQMDYYIAPQEPVTDFLRIAKPEDIKLCDPACGSGHMLTYAFDLLYAIYEEEGTDPAEIPEKILTHNLYGVEIDERAAELAAFALTMKARGKQRRFLNKRIQPAICVLRPVKIAPQDLDAYVAEVGRDLFTANLRTLLTQFEEADNFGSLIRPVAMDYAEIRRVLAEKGIGNQLLLEHVHRDVLRVLEQAEYLSQRYQVVVANPPYMGGRGMNSNIAAWAKDNFPNSKADTFAMFMERGFELAMANGFVAMVVMEAWMFLTTFETLRRQLLEKTILTMIHMPYLGKGGTSMGINFGTAATVFCNALGAEYKANYYCIRYFETDDCGVPTKFPVLNERTGTLSALDLKRIPGSPISYWVKKATRESFSNASLSKFHESGGRCKTSDDETYLRMVWEASFDQVGTERKWCQLYKGGAFRKYYGNREHLIRWDDDAKRYYSTVGGLTQARFWCERGITWTIVSSRSAPSFRLKDFDGQYNSVSPTIFPLGDSSPSNIYLISLLNSVVGKHLLLILNPTLALNVGDVLSFPLLVIEKERVEGNGRRLIELAKDDWNSFETSLGFTGSPLLARNQSFGNLQSSFVELRQYWQLSTSEMISLESENNRLFVSAYGLTDELTTEVIRDEITLTCNPHYRYGGDKSEQELEDLLRADTMREFISYAVGCMFGRYSLDKPGLILANQGETLEDYLRQVPEPRFTPDTDNVIPLLDGDWFSDDITGRFREFLRVTFGDEHYDENLRFIETALGKKGKPLPIRDFFLKEFYTDHVKRYKKRPIYWLFSSPKGSFNALIYLHRYRSDTVSIVLQYLRDFRSKLVSERDHQTQVSISTSASQGEKTKALKRIEELKKILVELDDYERDTLYPLATHQVVLDLDDGVKVNYAKLGAALKKIPGLDAKDED